MPLLSVRDLHISFPTPYGVVRACAGVGFDVEAGEVLGIVGESGSGKTMTALSILGLVPPPGRVEAGSITLNGEQLVGARARRLRALRGNSIGMVFQDAGRALDPVHTIRFHLQEAAGKGTDYAALLGRVGLGPALLAQYPHELSGGQRQRVMIAIARNPRLIIADEPTTAVDSVSQLHVMHELARVRRELGCALIVISHNLGLISRIADRIVVMYLGQVLEQNTVEDFVRAPLHPYSRALLAATPTLTSHDRLQAIAGAPPRMTEVPSGCPFHPRCAHAVPDCAASSPRLRRFGDRALAACHELGREVPV